MRSDRLQPNRPARVLIIDDEPLVARAIARALHGHEIVSASGGKDALEHLALEPSFDVILCDLMMPEMTGMDFFEELSRRDPAAARTVVFLTGGAFTDRARRFLHEVPNARLGKPFGAHELLAIVDSLVQSAGSL